MCSALVRGVLKDKDIGDEHSNSLVPRVFTLHLVAMSENSQDMAC